MSSMSPLQSPHFYENKAELNRLRLLDQKNVENTRLRLDARLASKKGELRRREAELNERAAQLREDRAALDQQRAENMLVDLGDETTTFFIPSDQTMATAAAIVAAGEKRRNETGPPPLPQNDQAKAIILSGRARRAEALTADERRWLDNYCRKQDARR